MPFPEVRHLVVCEDLRPEILRKLTILGFYGVAPDVTILVRDISQPIERLSFLMVCGPFTEPSKATIEVEIRHEDGTLVETGLKSSDIPVTKSEKAQLTIGLQGLIFPKLGSYIFALKADGRTHFEGRFEVRQGKEQDFKN